MNTKEKLKNLPIKPNSKIGDRIKLGKKLTAILGTDRNGKLQWQDLLNLAYK